MALDPSTQSSCTNSNLVWHIGTHSPRVMRRRRRFSDGSFAAVAPTIGDSPPRFEPAEGVTAGELEEILQKKELTPREVMVIRQSMVQSEFLKGPQQPRGNGACQGDVPVETQDRLWVNTEGVAGAPDRRLMGSASVSGDVVGDDSMVIGKGIMIKGDVEDCATLIVEGYFEGNYRGGFLAVPKGGKYVGMADVRRAEIGGRLHGTLSARTLLEVRSTGKIEGMVRYNELKMEHGGHMLGDVQQGSRPKFSGT